MRLIKWKEVKNFENYEVSDLGDVRNKLTGKMLKQYIFSNGYYAVTLCNNGKGVKCMVHRLVAEAFLPNLENLPMVSHLDESRLNNKVENLKWATYKENSNMPIFKEREALAHKGKKHSEETKRKMSISKTNKGRKVICVETGVEYSTIRNAAKDINICEGAISNCLSGRSKIAGGFHWVYGEVV